MEPRGGTEVRLAALKALGVRLAVDGFGLGCSSPAYFRNLPVDRLKIHRHIVQSVLDDAIERELADAILGLAKTLHMDVLAKGIETEGQREFMGRHGCAGGQGYLFGQPVPFPGVE